MCRTLEHPKGWGIVVFLGGEGFRPTLPELRLLELLELENSLGIKDQSCPMLASAP